MNRRKVVGDGARAVVPDGVRPSHQAKALLAHQKTTNYSGIRGKLVRCWTHCCQRLASSPYFSAVTTLLTFYALFGDDMRLLLSHKPCDPIFDIATAVCMAVFGMEIIVCSFGKSGYLFGFFFFLDIISTVTLVLDITVVAEWLFGDSISMQANAQESSGGGSTGGDSAQAARAARMSRAGTKAGRVVRLIRLMRLIRLIKIFRNPKKIMDQSAWMEPGDDFEDDEMVHANQNESAVSKKLSEMTTRRVIMLVLSILLTLPFFQANMYGDSLSTSAQYGIDSLFRLFRDGMQQFDPTSSSQNSNLYMQSMERQNYENDFMQYVYYHNWFCGEVPSDKANSPLTSFAKIFWLGGSPTDSKEAEFFLPRSQNGPRSGLNSAWNGDHWALYQCDLPVEAQLALQQTWNETHNCLDGKIRGVSLIESRDSRARCPSDLRFQERMIVSPIVMSRDESSGFVFMFVFDKRSGSQMEAALNSGQTVFICLLLGVGAMTFSRDANTLVLSPIERMIMKLDKIRANPIAAMSLGEDDAGNKAQLEAYRRSVEEGTLEGSWNNAHSLRSYNTHVRAPSGRCGRLREWISRIQQMRRGSGNKAAPEPMETVVLEKTIIKIGSLLALGFGEAGAEIIGQNMRGNDTAALNAMIPGKKVDGIFGFVDIRNFSDVTEVLEAEIMVFVNRIANIVHSCVHEFYGSPNQNVGDAFLIVWRLSELEEEKQRKLADMSIVSFMKITANISKSPVLAEYREVECLTQRIHNYRVRMGFGLHKGWAIEGAIGSEFKIDASYLSTNVAMASRLEGLTQLFGTGIVISELVVELMNEGVVELCRLIDNVAWSDSAEPLKLYTVDLNDEVLGVDPTLVEPRTKTGKFRRKFDRQRRKLQRWSDDFLMKTYVKHDDDFKHMREGFAKEFFTGFAEAYRDYAAGDWERAATKLEAIRFRRFGDGAHDGVGDGPSAALLKFLDKYDYQAPKDWPGFRFLSDA